MVGVTDEVFKLINPYTKQNSKQQWTSHLKWSLQLEFHSYISKTLLFSKNNLKNKILKWHWYVFNNPSYKDVVSSLISFVIKKF